ncbi:hypothetical protein [Humidesulfovibrio sp.]
MPAPATKPKGFTIVELIVIIVVAGFLGMVLVNMLGTRLLKSAAPLASARDAVQAETAMESVVAFYTQTVNNSTTGALDAVVAQYPNNATFSATRNNNFDGVGLDALIVTVTENGLSLTTVLTQERTNDADNATNF